MVKALWERCHGYQFHPEFLKAFERFVFYGDFLHLPQQSFSFKIIFEEMNEYEIKNAHFSFEQHAQMTKEEWSFIQYISGLCMKKSLLNQQHKKLKEDTTNRLFQYETYAYFYDDSRVDNIYDTEDTFSQRTAVEIEYGDTPAEVKLEKERLKKSLQALEIPERVRWGSKCP